ncbi:MAG: transporter substrate-binding domain-containing protein, partial [Fimbriimonadales bacterium]
MRLARALLGLGACILLCGCGFNGRTERPVPQPHRDAPAETAARERNSRPKERTLRLACNEWPPYVLKAGSEREGFAVDLTREALRRMGWRLEFLNRPWARGVEEMRRGELDGLICAYRAPGRTWAFHDVPLGLGPEWSDEFVILKRKGSGWMYRAPEDLQSAR